MSDEERKAEELAFESAVERVTCELGVRLDDEPSTSQQHDFDLALFRAGAEWARGASSQELSTIEQRAWDAAKEACAKACNKIVDRLAHSGIVSEIMKARTAAECRDACRAVSMPQEKELIG